MILSIDRIVSLRIADPRGDVWRLLLDDTNGRGFVSLTAPAGWAASYYWPARGRGPYSLPAFLFGCDSSYVAGKFGIGDEFDGPGTERAVKVELYRGNRKDYADLVRTLHFHSARDWEEWIRNDAPGPEPWERFPMRTHIRPDFRRFYEYAWPILRERRAEIVAVLYPDGVPVANVTVEPTPSLPLAGQATPGDAR